ncbi:adhesion G-protein coupled receptor G5 isoform X1 [Phyllostomus hastatus]|uniref:adhesion G-protein coupled receptor G5 isoform X1 n=2 Tax=Phyllostomus hastatus TaxID=9423 RepID=UPI001E685897|nr:adhesion G-protein coupled receptor G5 isoform X1 [Phyllostomus hastatus]XP_045674363.1 adhesion G-protein coupled receptor G5 isoform X1 [Phyllostomus hastatus]
MGRHAALLLCLCLVTAQSEAEGTAQEVYSLMYKMNMKKAITDSPESAPMLVHSLEQRLLNVTFNADRLILPLESIQALAFNLNCSFPGLALSSDTLSSGAPKQPQQARAKIRHAMQFPKELTQRTCRLRSPSRLRLICIYFSTDRFFQSDNKSLLLHNYVLGAQLDNESVNDLREPINISFWHNESLEGYVTTCVFWKEGASKRYWGAWSPEGCRTEHPSDSQVLCRCNHLSYFAVLMQLSQDPLPAELLAPLTYISLVGCSISIVASLLTVLLYFLTRKKGDSLTNIHMNLHASVLLLNVTFLLSPILAVPSAPGSACRALAATLHYALLSCLTWMAIEGFNLYLLLVRVYNIYIRRYVLKLCVVGWGVPAFLVLLLLAIKSSVYGRHTIVLSGNQGDSRNVTGSQNTSICWVQSPGVHGALVIGYGGLTSLFNLVVLVWALRVLRRMKAQEKAPGSRACKDTVTVLGLTILLGTTWTLAFFSFGVFLLPQLFLFTILNSLYGFFLFLWFCFQRCRSEAVAAAEGEMEAFSSSQMMQ